MTRMPHPDSAPLHIVCPRPKQLLAIMLSCACFSVLAGAAVKLLDGPPERFSWFKVWMVVLMGTAMAALLYRNLFMRDALYLYREKAEDWALENENVLVLAAASVRALRLCPRPGEYSSEGKYAALGLGPGLVEIETTDGCYRFGAGLDEDMAAVTARKIAAYCGLYEVGPQWKVLSDTVA
jgi:hypothetical protein